jgi:hypothetical protein
MGWILLVGEETMSMCMSKTAYSNKKKSHRIFSGMFLISKLLFLSALTSFLRQLTQNMGGCSLKKSRICVSFKRRLTLCKTSFPLLFSSPQKSNMPCPCMKDNQCTCQTSECKCGKECVCQCSQKDQATSHNSNCACKSTWFWSPCQILCPVTNSFPSL